MVALRSLVGAVKHLGIPPGLTDLDVVKRLVDGFVDGARALEGWRELREEACVQTVVDLGFLCLVKGDKVDEDPSVKAMLAKVRPSTSFQGLPQVC